MRTIAIVAAIYALATATPVFSQSAEDEIVITATREPKPLRDVVPTVQIITQADIQRLQPKDLSSLLGRLSGVTFRDSGGRGSVGGVSIRGTASTQSIILIDGVRTSSATIGATALEGLPVETIERIELVKGPLSGLYGADAIGGVIQIFTKQGSAQRITPIVHAEFRTDDTQQYTAELGGGNERGGFHSVFSYETTQGIDRTSIKTGGNHDRDGFKELAFSVNGHYRLVDDLLARVSILRTDAHSEFDNTFGADTGFDSDTKAESSSLKLIYTPLDRLRLSFDAGYFKDKNITPVFFSDVTTRRMSLSFQADYELHDNHTVSGGVDFYDDRVATLSAFSETSRDNLGGFFQWQGRYGNLAIVGNVRHDDNERYGDQTNGSVALEYRLSDNLSVMASFGTAFRAPSFNDLFFPFFGNPDIEPEESENIEFGISGQHLNVDWRASYFHTDVDNLIGFDAATFTANNVSKATLQGVELAFTTQIAGWTFDAGFDYLDAEDDTTNEYLDDRAKFSTDIQFYRQLGQFDLGLDLQAESGRHDLRGTSIDGFVVLGASASYRFARYLRFSARLDNMFDEDYTQNLISATEHYRTYGRTFQIGVHAQY
ncbi:MAG: TonB-dependent receptor domain-containing protein [Gammaproteobacteria bacterium]